MEDMEIRLDLEGIHCASCAARIEKQLNRLDGVEATVNLATEQATVRCPPEIGVHDLVAAVDAAGYHARVASPSHGHDHDEPIDVLQRRLAVAVVLTIPVALLAMVPALRFD